MYKHPEDRRAHRRLYYRNHRQPIVEAAAEWYAAHKDDEDYKKRKREYMREWRKRRRLGK